MCGNRSISGIIDSEPFNYSKIFANNAVVNYSLHIITTFIIISNNNLFTNLIYCQESLVGYWCSFHVYDYLPLCQCPLTFLIPNRHKDMPSIISYKHVFPIDVILTFHMFLFCDSFNLILEHLEPFRCVCKNAPDDSSSLWELKLCLQ